MRKVKAQKVDRSGGRPKAADYDDLTKEVIAIAISLYRCKISTVQAFPDRSVELDFVIDAWKMACENQSVQMELTPRISKIVHSFILYIASISS